LIYDKIIEENQCLDRQIKIIQGQLKKLPKGKLENILVFPEAIFQELKKELFKNLETNMKK